MAENSANPAGSAAEAIFNEALGRPASERTTYVAKACGADLHLRARVEALLEAHAAPKSFLPEEPGAGPKLDLSQVTVEALPADEKPGDTIGRYKLLKRIGEGGFGSVYVAEQKEPVKRQVALKIIKLGMNTRQVVARFQTERQALALLDHPSIAKVFDAGASETGRPYFVMELVKGVRITDYCDRNQISTRQRLELFVQVCRAVQHAHQKGIIHRDLKPSNILVALRDGQPVPKIIDFGIAKATQAELTEQTVFTEFGHFIGTPAYMSPEQAELSRLDVDTRSDIYSLGVLLYELLTGTTPFDTKELLSGGWEEMRRTIKHQVPSRPSTRLTRELAAQRTGDFEQSKIKNQKSKIAADLDWIVMKCLEKDRTRRYETANGLASDIQRHLNNEPVVARPPSRLYEFQKSVRRHKVGFAAAAAVILALSVGVVLSTWEGVQARKAEREAVRAKADATKKLWGSYLAEARAGRRSGESGQRFDSLVALSNAAAIRPSLELRNEAIACMALADLRVINEKHKVFKHGQEFANVDTTLQKYALGRTNGEVSIRQVEDDRELARLPSIGADSYALSFNPDGNLLAVRYADARTIIWDLLAAKIRAEVSPGPFALSPDFKSLARLESNCVAFYDTATRQKQKLVYLDRPAFSFRHFIQPNDRPLALFADEDLTTVLIFDVNSGKTLSILNHPGTVYATAWCPGSSFLAAACDDNLIYIWDTVTGQKVRTLAGHKGTPVSLDFSHDGRLLISSGYDGGTRLWNFAIGRQLVIGAGGGRVSFGPDDRAIVAQSWDNDDLAFLEVEDGKEVRTIYEVGRVPGAPQGGAHFSRTGRLLVYSTTNGATIFDVKAQREIGSVEGPLSLWVSGFAPDDHSVLGVFATNYDDAQFFRWNIESESNGELKPAPQIELGGKAFGTSTALSADGKYCVSLGRSRAQVIRTDTLEEVAVTGVQRDMRTAAMSPDGKWLATGPFHGHGVKIWEAQTAKLVKDLPFEEEGTTVTFSPDGHWLVCGMGLQYQFWEVGTWSAGLHIKQERGARFMPMMAFSPDGKILAGTFTFYSVRLFNAATGEILADIEAPDPWTVTCLSFSPDGSQLAVCEGRNALRLWDLRRIREHLAQMRLDWDLPPYPSPVASTSTNRSR